jgi:hypothetical protein
VSERFIELLDATGAVIQASLLDGLKPSDLTLIEREWWPHRLDILVEIRRKNAPVPESLHWDWSKKARELELLEADGFGIVCEGKWQGAMLTKSARYFARLEGDAGKPLVYIDYLEVAPWNWNLSPVGQTAKTRGVGSVLFREAVRYSDSQGFHGRVGLHSLPQSVGFYGGPCQMTSLGPDASKQDLVYFELSRERASTFLN